MVRMLSALFLAPLGVFALDVGSPAPPLTIAKWFSRGEAKIEPGKVYVVEFWATWCGPCLQSMPKLGKLQKAQGAKGLVVIGISNEAQNTVQEFVKKHPEMDYHVAVDDKNATWEAWMKGISGIPHAVVVDRKGVVVWKGHPMSGMDRVVERVLAGTYGEKERKATQLGDQLQAQLRSNELEKAEKTCFEILALDAENDEAIDLLCRLYAHVQKPMKELFPKLAETFAGKPDALSRLAILIMNQEAPEDRDLALALSSVKEAQKLSTGASAAVLRARARLEYFVGLIPRAIATAEEAAAAAQDEDEKKALEAEVAYYRSALAAQKKLMAE
jgi:thiol-disulfide isomerase/thioredoxin